MRRDDNGDSSPEAVVREMEALKPHLAAEVMRRIQALAEDARGHQWLHKDTAEVLDKIQSFAKAGAEAMVNEDEGGEDFPH